MKILNVFLVMFCVGCGVICCSPPSEEAKPQSDPSREGGQPGSNVVINERLLANMQEKVERLEQNLTAMQAAHQQQIQENTELVRQLNRQLKALRGELAQGTSGQAPAAATLPIPQGKPQKDTPGKEASAESSSESSAAPSHPFLRLLLVIVLFAAIFYIIKIFMGRWGEEEEEEDEEAEDLEIQTDEGVIRISPEVQAAAGKTMPGSTKVPDDSPGVAGEDAQPTPTQDRVLRRNRDESKPPAGDQESAEPASDGPEER